MENNTPESTSNSAKLLVWGGRAFSLLCLIVAACTVDALRTMEVRFFDVSRRLQEQIETLDTLRATEVRVSDASRRLEKQIEMLQRSSEMRTAGTDSAKVSPVLTTKATPTNSDFEDKLKTLEHIIRTVDLRRNAVSSPAQFQESVRQCLRLLQSGTESQWLPRINVIRWAEQAFFLLNQAAFAGNAQWERVTDSSADLLANVPDGISDELVKELTIAHGRGVTAFADYRRKEAMKEASTEMNSSSTTHDPALLLKLDEWKDHSTDGAKVTALQKALRNRIALDEIRSQDNKLTAFLTDAKTEPQLLQAGLSRFLESAINRRLALVGDSEASSELLEKWKTFQDRIELEFKGAASSRRDNIEKHKSDYQRWALTQVQAFDSAFNKAEKAVKGTVLDSPDYNKLKSAMVEWLLPISQPHLEPAVLRLFQASFERGWKRLEDQKSIQTEVAKQEATIKKTLPESD